MPVYKLRMSDGEREFYGTLQSDSGVIDYRPGDDPISVRKSPGRTKYEGITLERGVTQDSSFSNWASAVAASASGSEVPSKNFRKSIFLEFSEEAGQAIARYDIQGSSLTERQLVPPGGVTLHNLLRRDGKTVEEKLWQILEETLKRLSHRS